MEKNQLLEYASLIADIKDKIYKRQYDTLKYINSQTIKLYWEIGEEIYKQQQEKEWGKSVVEILAIELQKEFPGAKGYSAQNLWRMRSFYLEYTFDFAELTPEYTEHELEIELVNNIRAFLIEMGGDFTFVGNQYHLKAGEHDLYIDLLLFHRKLRSLVAIELKIGEFEAEYAGKMQLYLTALDETVKLPEENASIGIIICKSKDKTYVEYALKQSAAPIGVATYKLSNDLPENMKALLPEPEMIAERLAIFEQNAEFEF